MNLHIVEAIQRLLGIDLIIDRLNDLRNEVEQIDATCETLENDKVDESDHNTSISDLDGSLEDLAQRLTDEVTDLNTKIEEVADEKLDETDYDHARRHEDWRVQDDKHAAIPE